MRNIRKFRMQFNFLKRVIVRIKHKKGKDINDNTYIINPEWLKRINLSKISNGIDGDNSGSDELLHQIKIYK